MSFEYSQTAAPDICQYFMQKLQFCVTETTGIQFFPNNLILDGVEDPLKYFVLLLWVLVNVDH